MKQNRYLQTVAKRLKELKTNKSSGLNDPNVEILKSFADFIAIPLADIFNESFNLVQVLTNYVVLHLLVFYQSFKSPTL